MDRALDRLPHSGTAGIIDDAVATGTTIRYVAAYLKAAAVTPLHIVVCAATGQGRRVVRMNVQSARWTEYVHDDDWYLAHLRDGCPFLPFSGRGTDHPALALTGGLQLEVRSPGMSVLGSLWHVMSLDKEIRSATDQARADIVAGLRIRLGRPPVVGDLLELGAKTTALQTLGEELHPQLPL